MHELFERWVEHLVRLWAHGFGGQVRSGRTCETLIPIHWQRSTAHSLRSLVPDLVVGKDAVPGSLTRNTKGISRNLTITAGRSWPRNYKRNIGMTYIKCSLMPPRPMQTRSRRCWFTRCVCRPGRGSSQRTAC